MKFYIHKLGCPKNDVDADYLTARLLEAGHEYVSEPEQAEAIIVNTCGFILPAKEESIDAILQLARLKKTGQVRRLYAAGCLSQRYGTDLVTDIPELDGVFGIGEIETLAHEMSSPSPKRGIFATAADELRYLSWKGRHIADDFPYAYLKISDGCNRTCTFCAIPAIRGQYRSRPIDEIVREAEYLAAHGKKELILVSQEATLYGYDLGEKSNLVTLLRALDSVEGVEWIRVMYLHPLQLDIELIDYFAAENKTLPYFDLPLQHINSEILAAMGRQMRREEVEEVLGLIRERCPEATVRTVFIVGFPGETEEHFQELLRFIADYRFDRVGVFGYSAEEGTPAAALAGQLDEETINTRQDLLMSLQQEIAFAKNENLIGSVQDVIIDTVKDDIAVGRTRGDCPEIDQEVYVEGYRGESGAIIKVTVTAADGYDIRGTFVEA